MKKRIRLKKGLEGYSFVFPGFLYMVVILGYPLIYNFALSFRNTNIKTFKAGTSVFVGLQNYVELFQNPVFRLAVRNTFIFTVFCLIFQFTIGFLLALFFAGKFRLAGPVRGLMLVPYMMPMVVTAMLGKNMFGVDGVLNDLILKSGLTVNPVEWLVSSNLALVSVIAVNCWVGIPFNMLLLTSGLTGISQEVYDSAAVDGVNAFQKFFYITLPLMKQTMLAVLMLGFIYTFKVFDLVFIMTSGGPSYGTEMLSTFSYNQSFTQYDFSKGAAAAVVLFVCLFVIGLFYLRLATKEED